MKGKSYVDDFDVDIAAEYGRANVKVRQLLPASMTPDFFVALISFHLSFTILSAGLFSADRSQPSTFRMLTVCVTAWLRPST
jgi:hypothetical protein